MAKLMTWGDSHQGVVQLQPSSRLPGRHSKAHCSHKDGENMTWIWSLFFLHILSHMSSPEFSGKGYTIMKQTFIAFCRSSCQSCTAGFSRCFPSIDLVQAVSVWICPEMFLHRFGLKFSSQIWLNLSVHRF